MSSDICKFSFGSSTVSDSTSLWSSSSCSTVGPLMFFRVLGCIQGWDVLPMTRFCVPLIIRLIRSSFSWHFFLSSVILVLVGVPVGVLQFELPSLRKNLHPSDVFIKLSPMLDFFIHALLFVDSYVCAFYFL